MKTKSCVCAIGTRTLALPVFCSFYSFLGFAFAQETEQQSQSAGIPMPARVIGEVSDGTPAPPAPPKALPNHEVETTKVRQQGKRRIILNRVVQPPKQLPAENQPAQNAPVQGNANLPQGGIFTIYATVYDEQRSYVKWNHDGRKHEAWSNTNFNLLEGFHSFEGRGKTYNFFIIIGDSTMEDLEKARAGEGDKSRLPEIPDFTELDQREYPAYILMKGDAGDTSSLEFIEAIHDLYEAEYDRLFAACVERKKNREMQNKKAEELRNNPPPKPDIIVNYWKKESAQKETNPEAAK